MEDGIRRGPVSVSERMTLVWNLEGKDFFIAIGIVFGIGAGSMFISKYLLNDAIWKLIGLGAAIGFLKIKSELNGKGRGYIAQESYYQFWPLKRIPGFLPPRETILDPFD